MFIYTAAGGWFPGEAQDKIRQAAAHGFSAVEILLWKKMDLAEVKKAIAETGCKISAILCRESADEHQKELVDNGHGIVWEDAKDAFVNVMRETIAVAKELGVTKIVATTGNERFDVPRTVQHHNVVTALRAVAPMLEEAGIVCVLEPLNVLVNHRGYYLTTTEESAQIIREVDSPNVRILYDVYHQQITEGNLINNIRANIDLIGHIHLGDVPGRKEPGTGEINYPKVLQAIADTGYDQFVVFECGMTEDVDTVCKKMWAMYEALN